MMHRLVPFAAAAAAAVAVVLGCALPLSAQPGPAASSASLDGWAFPVPAGYQPVATPADAHLAVFRDPRTRTTLFVATVPEGTHRTDALARARAHAAAAALGREPGTVEWRSIPSFAVSGSEIYHDCRIASGAGGFAAVQLRLLRVGGRDVATGYAVPLAREEGQRVVGMPFFYAPNAAAAEASSPVVRALAGETAAPVASSDAEDAAVRAAKAALAAATREKDPDAVLERVARPYLEFLDDMRHLALHAPAERVRAEPLIHQFYVLDLRHRVPAAELRTMDARALLAHAWDTGWLGTGGWKEDTLQAGHAVVVEGDVAFARRAAEEGGRARSSPVSWTLQTAFKREDGAWKVDALSAVPLLESVLRTRVEAVGGRPDAAPLVVLQQLSGKLLEANVWNPPAQP